MRKTILTAVALAGTTFVVLFVILGVTLWVSFLAAGGSAVVGAGLAQLLPGRSGQPETGARLNPIVDVDALRVRFGLTVDLCILGGFLSAEVFAFSRSTAADVGFAAGIATLLLGFVLSPTVRRVRAKQVIGLATGLRLVAWDAIACATVTIGTWQIVQSRTFGLATTKWISFADGLAMLALGLAALILHEVSTEHVVHSLEITEGVATNARPPSPEVPKSPMMVA